MNPETPGVETPIVAPAEAPVATGNTTVGEALDAQSAAPQEAPQTPSSEPVTPVTEDTRDFRAYAKKLEGEVKELKSFKQLYQQAKPEVTAPVQAVAPSAAPQTEEQALQLLESVINKSLEAKLNPLLENQILDDFQKKPYVQALGPEIATELAKLPDSLPLNQRLETARAFAIANNVDTFAQVNRQMGAEQAYQNQALKTAQAPTAPGTNQAMQPRDDLLTRVLNNQISTKEYSERRGEIDQLVKEHTFNNPGIA